MKPGLLIAITGLPGSGKTTAAVYLAQFGFPVVYMGRITKVLLEEERLGINEKNEKYLRGSLRKKYGKEIYARLVLPEIEGHVKAGKNVFLEGLRSPEELNFLKKYFKKIKILHLETEKKIRYERVLRRKKVPLTIDQIKERDKEEWQLLGLNKLIAQADFIVNNDTTKEHLHQEINNLLDAIKRT